MLWLALRFPLLPLEALPLRQSPSAVVTRGRVLVGDRQALEAGVGIGQKLSTALGLQPGLAVFERDIERERRALENLACWAGSFTPTISLATPAGLLLEIGGCLRLFGGVSAIVEAVLTGCAEQGYSTTWAAAPTALGAGWLAQAGAGSVHQDMAGLQAALVELPCAIPGWPREIENRLASFGLKYLGDLLALPTAGLRQRIGNGPVNDLLRACGELPDPQQPYLFPETFAIALELPARVEHAEALAFAGQRLFAALAGWLHGRQLLLRSCSLQLTHDDASLSTVSLRFAEPAADEGRFMRLLREHLARLKLAAPVEALRLLADELENKSGASAHLFDQAPAGEGALACLERLRARLGEGAVHRMAEKPDYRPECATLSLEVAPDSVPSTTLDKAAQPKRPLWLFPVPQILAERAGRPQWHGPLQFLSRPERLESGWWDEGEQGGAGDVQRDYFVVRNPHGQWAWVFRAADGWYLHGLFA